ncbi:sigma-E factor negative regulatory protein [Thiocapsa bogorovii]|uniref:sigma-E factor negative regulatory protein n=1 Tax=Thiocapsa bogorovii TaxID=521689 RepID=UPI001E4AEA4E|nr:sigma-E factor negative regulatory protein [Thiocapsa bogorovii]UHD17017.1 sigma-E factor negative regulatory protein [Thiocapsa bogorovii]
MSDELRQRISELQDGELDPAGTARLVDAMAGNPGLRGTWERYHTIGLAIRGESVHATRRGVADVVRERIAHEPTVLAPPRGDAKPPKAKRPVAAVALAAAAAFLAVFVVPGLFDGVSPLPSVRTAPTLAAQPGVVAIPAQRWDLEHPELANKLDLFLVTHQETAPTTGAKGMLPYATFVGYEAGR